MKLAAIASLLLLAVACNGMHQDDIEYEAKAMTMDEYMELVSASVDNEIDSNSCMGHTPPNRWYYSAGFQFEPNNAPGTGTSNPLLQKYWEEKQQNLRKSEIMLALVILNHYKYVRQLRRRVAYIKLVLNGNIDLWPAKQPKCSADESTTPEPVQTDCTKFYQCSEGAVTIQKCAEGTVFNPNTFVCDWPDNVPECNPKTGHYKPGTFEEEDEDELDGHHDDNSHHATRGHGSWMQPQWLSKLMMQQDDIREAWQELKAGDTVQ